MSRAIHICFGGPVVRIGRWLVELHPYCGPIVLRADGEPRRRQPVARSPFWEAFRRMEHRAVKKTRAGVRCKVATWNFD